jgi:hypothetical protein
MTFCHLSSKGVHSFCGLARKSSEVRAGVREGALDFLAFFASFWSAYGGKKKELLMQELLLIPIGVFMQGLLFQ